MGKFKCHCGYVISDSVSPCPHAGDLHWDPENDASESKFVEAVDSYFAAVKRGEGDEWIDKYFALGYAKIELSIGELVSDIRTKADQSYGRGVLQCTECNRIYIQKKVFVNEWDCYEPRP